MQRQYRLHVRKETGIFSGIAVTAIQQDPWAYIVTGKPGIIDDAVTALDVDRYLDVFCLQFLLQGEKFLNLSVCKANVGRCSAVCGGKVCIHTCDMYAWQMEQPADIFKLFRSDAQSMHAGIYFQVYIQFISGGCKSGTVRDVYDRLCKAIVEQQRSQAGRGVAKDQDIAADPGFAQPDSFLECGNGEIRDTKLI